MASLARILGLTFLFLVGCRAPCYLDPVENFTYDARSDYLLLDPEFGPMTFGFLYQDRLMRGIWTEEELALGADEGIWWYANLPGRRVYPETLRSWSVFISNRNDLDPLWTDICQERPRGCSCPNGGLFPPTFHPGENQFGLAGIYLEEDSPEVMCHEALHVLRWHDLGDTDKNHADTELWRGTGISGLHPCPF